MLPCIVGSSSCLPLLSPELQAFSSYARWPAVLRLSSSSSFSVPPSLNVARLTPLLDSSVVTVSLLVLPCASHVLTITSARAVVEHLSSRIEHSLP